MAPTDLAPFHRERTQGVCVVDVERDLGRTGAGRAARPELELQHVAAVGEGVGRPVEQQVLGEKRVRSWRQRNRIPPVRIGRGVVEFRIAAAIEPEERPGQSDKRRR